MRYVLGLVLSSIALYAVADEKHAYQYAAIGANRIAYSCIGEGETTFVFISGMGLDAHRSFGNTYHRYKGPGRLCLYDRAELGESSFANPKPRSLAAIAEELHALVLANAWTNVTLVAHSFGGYIARAYAEKYPKELKGIVFVDCVREEWLPALKQKMAAQDWAQMQSAIDYGLRSTHEDYLGGQAEASAFGSLGALPITVISRGQPQINIRIGGMSYTGIDIFNAEHARLQPKLVALSTSTKHVIAKYSAHVVDETDPWLIIDELAAMEKRVHAR